MKRTLGILLLTLILSSFVIAESEISMNFVINNDTAKTNYAVHTGYWNNYGDYIIVVLIVLILVYITLKIKKKRATNTKKKKASKKKTQIKKKK